MTINLETITTKYRRFTKNQVLTADQLNEIVNFFDDQDRLTRICLNGVGIVCGFKVSFDHTTNILTISQGAGVTTDGDLFRLYQNDEETGEKTMDIENKQYTHYKIHDNEKADYKPFFYDGSDQLEIFELLTVEQEALEIEDTFLLGELETNAGLAVTQGVVLLYLECYEKEQDLCVSLTCDDQGVDMVGNYKALIVSKSVADQINGDDSIISKTNYTNLYHQLPNVLANRVVLHPENFTDYPELKRQFTNGTFGNNVVDRLRDGFEILLNAMNLPILLNAVEVNLTGLFSYDGDAAPPDFQYRYDLLKDLIDTYNEIKGALFGLEVSGCCPDVGSFPKHLMLGEVSKNGPCYQYRHAFYKSPLLAGQNLSTCTDCLTFDLLLEPGTENTVSEFVIDIEANEIDLCFGENTDEQRLLTLIKRAVQLLGNYNSNYLFIKITPSLNLGLLGKKAIPFYTNVGDHLINLWDFDKTVLGKQRNNLGYHRNMLNIKRPLEVCIDHDFYRIEGHQGRNYKEALEVIQNARREHGLGFNVIALSINASEAQDFVENYTSPYLNKNHGYEHKAGVAPGGTFVMIYIEGEFNSYPYPYGYGYPYEYPYGYYNGDSLAGDFEGEAGEDLVVLNPVVADFTLPYLCCDENFITLSLPTDVLCFDEETLPIPFQVTPNGGYVAAEVDEGLNGGVVKNGLGVFVFDPNLVSEELYGSPITFTVNNFETDSQITIFKKPEFDFEVENMDPNSANEVIVSFRITGENLIADMEYSWDFGDGSTPVSTTELTIQHTYAILDAADNIREVSLSGGEDSCVHEVIKEITLEIPIEIILTMEVSNICRNDDNAYLISTIPEDVAATITGEGISITSTGEAVFIATNVGSTVTNSITVLINGQPSNLVIELEDAPVASFNHTIANNRLTLSNNSDKTDQYRWVVEGERIERDTRTQVVRSLDLYDGDSILVALSAVSDNCGEATDGPRRITIREEIVDGILCIDRVRNFVEKSMSNLENLERNFNFSGRTNAILVEIRNIEEKLQQDMEAFTKGDNNRDLEALFTEDILNRFLSVIGVTDNDEEQNVLRQLFEIYVITFYTILRCQEPAVLNESTDRLTAITDSFNSFFEKVLSIEFNVDSDGSLKETLGSAREFFTQNSFLVDAISKHIDNLEAGEGF